MKSVVVLVILFGLIQAKPLTTAERHEIALECIDKTGIDRRLVEQAIAGDIPQVDAKYKDFLTCSYKKQKYQDEDGQILINNIKEFLQGFYKASDLVIVDKCEKAGTGGDHGENAVNALNCIIEQLHKLERSKNFHAHN